MARYDKGQIVQIVDNLLKANHLIKQINIGYEAEVADILQICQESAILVGTQLESKAGLEHIVHMLEEYCESLYEFSTNYADFEARMTNSEKIQEQLLQIKNAMESDLPEKKKEVVFLPYKASMWDSLESVWKAADADPECDAYVIPIPYYDKNPDGTFREFHYEGDQYTDYVPITRYEDYDLEERHPDVIYIHNPYDDENYVTTVDPEYYSDKLRQETDELIYIPYFVLEEIDPDNRNAVESVKNFCLTKGVINADKVIVQSENMRSVYIQILEELIGKTDYEGVKWTDKILGLGSPKFDKICNTTKAEIEIPDAWKKIIQKPDGSWKKIVFYNTGLSPLLHYDDQMITKIRNVFKLFYEHRSDVALLWRPHPLIESTLVSMRPQLYQEYEKLKNEYIQEGWGIYDDSPDMDRAIVLSDAYYGAWSSVLQLYKKTGKPIMKENVGVLD